MAFRKKKMLCVEWEDASSSSDCISFAEAKKKRLFRCRTIGFLVHRGRDKITISSEHFNDGGMRNPHYIPRKTIISITELH